MLRLNDLAPSAPPARSRSRGAGLALLLMALACSDPTPPESVGTVAAVAGTDNQVAVVGTPVGQAPALLVQSNRGTPLAGVVVSFAVAAGGGTVTPASVTTDATGIARANGWTLGTVTGENRLTMSAAGGSAVTITATASPGAPAKAEKLHDGQSAPAGTAVAEAPAVVLKDQYDNLIPGIAVTFTVASGGGAVQGGSVTTDQTGTATVGLWTLGSVAGANTLRVTSGPLPAVTFTAQGTPGAPATVTQAGNGQQATVNAAVATAPSITVKDQFGNPVPGIQVQFAVAAGGGQVVGGSPTTDAAGVARVGSWTLGTTAGQNRLTATLSGLAPVQFTATGVAGPPGKLVAVSGDLQSDTVLAKLATPFVVKVTDQFDNPLAGVFVAYSVTAGGGSLTLVSATSDAQGLTQATLILGPTAGAQTVRAALQTGSVTPATFTATATYPAFFATEVAPGGAHTCARKSGNPGTVYCWGANTAGQLGNGTVLAAPVPTPVAGGIAFSGLAAGFDFTCGLDPVGRAYCWGGNGSGQIGDGTAFNRGSPTAVVGSFVYQKLVASDSTACGLMVTGDLRCWGANSSGLLGNGSTTSSNTPLLVSGGLEFRTVSLGQRHACGITTGGDTYCWGDNTDGVLGTNTNTTSLVPVAVALAPALVTVGAGAQHTCGATQAGAVYCWGKNPSGEMGAPAATTGSLVPLIAQFPAALAELVASGHGSCGRTIGGGPAQCWGFNGDGQLNVPATGTPYLAQPVQSAGAVSFAAVRLAAKSGCGIGSDGAVYCWGSNTGGQLGDGTTTPSLVPVRVRSR